MPDFDAKQGHHRVIVSGVDWWALLTRKLKKINFFDCAKE
jgi:hypothetical protein